MITAWTTVSQKKAEAVAAVESAGETQKAEIVSTANTAQSAAGVVGEIRTFASDKCPVGWLPCDGAEFTSSGQHEALFRAISTRWGARDSQHYNVPDLRGLFLRGWNGPIRNLDVAVAIADDGRTALWPGGMEAGVGSVQEDAVQHHTHTMRFSSAGDSNNAAAFGTNTNSPGHTSISSDLGKETRPRNAYVLYCIKK
jgi:microcystin-dependent protein